MVPVISKVLGPRAMVMAFSPTKEILDCGSNYLIHMGEMFELHICPVKYLRAWWGGKFLCNAESHPSTRPHKSE
jgi:hypothetical protein